MIHIICIDIYMSIDMSTYRHIYITKIVKISTFKHVFLERMEE